jgi:release factor glutamine methyltransferase
MPPKNSLTLQATLKTAAAKLTKAKIDSAWLDAELLLAFVLKKNRTFVLSHDEKVLSVTQAKRFHSLIQKRAKHVPVAYLLGEKEFYGLNFKVTKDTLVPRPFSESLVEKAIEILNNNPKAILIDIGTGSGRSSYSCRLSSTTS